MRQLAPSSSRPVRDRALDIFDIGGKEKVLGLNIRQALALAEPEDRGGNDVDRLAGSGIERHGRMVVRFGGVRLAGPVAGESEQKRQSGILRRLSHLALQSPDHALQDDFLHRRAFVLFYPFERDQGIPDRTVLLAKPIERILQREGLLLKAEDPGRG